MSFLDGPRPLLFAHRGGAQLWPENTLVAFRGALDLGITHLETDVHRTRDGEIVVFHDARLERTTNGRGFVRDHSLAELKKLDAGKGTRIPTLAELVALDPNAKLNIEMKQRGVDLPRQLFRFVETRGLHERVLVASAEHDLIREFRRIARGSVRTSASRREVLAFWLAVRTRISRFVRTDYDALQVPPRAGRLTVIEPSFMRAAHARGIHVHAWTIDDPAEMRALVALGVDGVMSDRPDVLIETLRPR